jgi:hypothetical protein
MSNEMSKQTYLWKSMREGFKSYHGEKTWKPGKWYKFRGELKMCKNGFHASERIIDAMYYVSMEILARVEVQGGYKKQSDKQCWREMRIVKAWKWTKKDSVALSIYSAGLVLKNFEDKHPDDKRPREAIQAAKCWLANPTEENRKAAHAAADAAARAAAAYAAYVAAYAAADAAARAATYAARAAAYATAYAANADDVAEKVRAKIDAWISRRIKKLEKIYDQE